MKRRFRIHPAIGVARMGDSNDFYIGAETPGVPGNWDDDHGRFKCFRDEDGKILRQGARFRVFQYDEDDSGSLSNPREVLPGGDIADIEWRVHLANRKASFFVFNGQSGAADIFVERASKPADSPEKQEPLRTNRRNPGVPVDQRAALEIDPGEQLVSGARRGPVELSNTNKSVPIKSLGTLRLDDNGRLIVLGGYGQSNSTEGRQIDEYANNDTWFDDASDGSVKARVKLADGTVIDADAAWVIVGPPDFAPGIGNVITLYDTLWDTAVRDIPAAGPLPQTEDAQVLSKHRDAWLASGGVSLAGYKPSFISEIYPILARALGARDVHNSGIGKQNYHQRLFRADLMAELANPASQRGAEFRKKVFEYMRDPLGTTAEWDKMPRGLGDEAYPALDGEPAQVGPKAFVSLPRVQYALLRQWASGEFVADWTGSPPEPKLNPNPRPDELDRAAAENCVGGPFFPGIEISWLIRTKELYAEPLRLKVPKVPESEASEPPLQIGALKFGPGFFSQQMALPWQADFYDCHKESHDGPDGTSYFFMWWTAQRPDDVYPAGSDLQQRWVRALDQAFTDPDDIEAIEGDNSRFTQMQQRWSQLKFVTVRNGDRFEEEA